MSVLCVSRVVVAGFFVASVVAACYLQRRCAELFLQVLRRDRTPEFRVAWSAPVLKEASVCIVVELFACTIATWLGLGWVWSGVLAKEQVPCFLRQ